MVDKSLAIESIVIDLANRLGSMHDLPDHERLAIMVTDDEWLKLQESLRRQLRAGPDPGEITELMFLGIRVIRFRRN